MERTRQLQTILDTSIQPALTASNVFFHESISPEYKDVVTPNVDTVYCTAWLDLSQNPVVLNAPDTDDRYYVMQIMDAYSNTFSSIGRRTTGTKAGKFAIVGPDWKGVLPSGLTAVKSPTNTAWLLGRVLSKGEDDVEEAMKILKQFTLTSLDGDTSPYVVKPANKLLLENKVEDLNAIDFFKTMTDLMILNPTTGNEFFLKQFEYIGINLTYGFDAGKLDQDTIRGLNRAAKDAFLIISNSMEEINHRFSNGWVTYTGMGAYGDQFLMRAFIAYMGLGANVDEEATCPRTFTDDQGNQLNGEYKYVLHFDKGQLPTVEAFWSVTMYDKDFYLVQNDIDRYAIADYAPEYNDDGSLDIYIQNSQPINHISNWLPAPEDDFNLLLRLYQPSAKILNGTYEVPGVKRIIE
ncbi:MAG: hypothetical protein BWY74_00770 [Firmicutes bacterium ADurb.Bin419]|nr:MAG: hypothetical protein BWY74_00770 [Firmicutes bacterium ADurb.Bin419]